MAKASKVTIAEVEEIVETGEIDPDQVHVPGMYVDRVIKGLNYEKALSVCVLLERVHLYAGIKFYCIECDEKLA